MSVVLLQLLRWAGAGAAGCEDLPAAAELHGPEGGERRHLLGDVLLHVGQHLHIIATDGRVKIMVKDTILYLTTYIFKHLNCIYFIYILYQNIYLILINFVLDATCVLYILPSEKKGYCNVMYSVRNLHSNSVQSKGVKNLLPSTPDRPRQCNVPLCLGRVSGVVQTIAHI